MQQRIAFDMDEVMADTLGHQLTWLNATHGHDLSAAMLRGDEAGRRTKDLVPWAHLEALEAEMHRGEFFADIPVMQGSVAVMEALYARFEVFVATAAMDYPMSCHAKFAWLRRHFPFIAKERFVFCGDKSVVRADFLVDDSARHFARFGGQGLLFDAPHNAAEKDYPRLHGWQGVAQYFKLPS